MSETMQLSVSLPMAGAWATPANILRVAHRAEALGYGSVWTISRLLYALEPRNDYPAAPGEPWPEPFRSVADSIVALAFVASATKHIRLATGVINPLFYSPVMLAKQLATLDVLSEGLLTVGVGLGWSEDEYEAVGTPFRGRGRRLDEFLECLTLLWTREEVEFHGEFYDVPRSIVEPSPVQRPHPPLLVGGYADAAFRRAVTLGDGYVAGNLPLAETAPLVARVQDAAEATGRDPTGLHVVSRGRVELTEEPRGPERRPLVGSLDEIREDIGRYREAGLSELFLEFNLDVRLTAPESDPDASLQHVLSLLEELSPARSHTP